MKAAGTHPALDLVFLGHNWREPARALLRGLAVAASAVFITGTPASGWTPAACALAAWSGFADGLIAAAARVEAAWASKMRIVTLGFGYLALAWTPQGWRFTAQPRPRFGMLYVPSGRQLKSKAFIMSLNPLLWIFTAACAFAAIRFGGGPWWTLVLAVALGVDWLLRILPYRFIGSPTEGAAMGALIGGETSPIESPVLAAVAFAESGVRPRDWDPALVDRLRTDSLSPDGMSRSSFLLYLHYLDQGDPGRAQGFLAELIGSADRHPLTPAQVVEVAYFQARYRGRPESSRRWLATISGASGVPPMPYLRALAAIHWAEGEPSCSSAHLNRIEAFLKRERQTGFTAMERDLADSFRADLEPPAPASVPLPEIAANSAVAKHQGHRGQNRRNRNPDRGAELVSLWRYQLHKRQNRECESGGSGNHHSGTAELPVHG